MGFPYVEYLNELEAERDRLREALDLLAKAAEEQGLLMPLHLQRKVNSVLEGTSE